MAIRTWLSAAAVAVVSSAAAVHNTVSHGSTSTAVASNAAATPLPPSKDPWYTAPSGYQNAAPGAVLRSRVATGLSSRIGNCSMAYNVLYRTTDSNYNPSWAVTTLLVPSAKSSTGAKNGSQLLSYQIPYDTADVDYSPSVLLYDSTPAKAYDPTIPISLGQGWYVNVPDYEGPLAAFTAGVQAGHATIDGVRAILNFGHGVECEAAYALWGYSGGALASEWAAELQVQYAPNMSFAGVALGGLTPNTTNVEETINGTPFAELLVNGILGLVAEDPTAKQYILSELKTTGPYNKTTFLSALHQNTTVDGAIFNDQNIFNYFKNGQGILQYPAIASLIDRDGIMGYHGVPQMPVYAYKAIHDEVSPIADTDALVQKYCAVGANILYQRNSVGGHVAEAVNGAPEAYKFLGAVLNGVYGKFFPTHGCTVQNVTIAIDSSPE